MSATLHLSVEHALTQSTSDLVAPKITFLYCVAQDFMSAHWNVLVRLGGRNWWNSKVLVAGQHVLFPSGEVSKKTSKVSKRRKSTFGEITLDFGAEIFFLKCRHQTSRIPLNTCRSVMLLAKMIISSAKIRIYTNSPSSCLTPTPLTCFPPAPLDRGWTSHCSGYSLDGALVSGTAAVTIDLLKLCL